MAIRAHFGYGAESEKPKPKGPAIGEWEPIEKYDAMKKKPPAVFLFKRHDDGRYVLPETVETDRAFGHRVCTHYLVLPPLPESLQSGG